jgi:hypothetical protein
MWGLAGSPILDGDRLIVHTGGQANACLLALDRNTGRELWRSLDDPAGYCTPILIQSPSGPQVVIWTPLNIRSVDPSNGKLLWTVPYKVTYGVSITTPIYRENVVFVTGYWEGSKAIRLGSKPEDATLIWEDNKALRGLMAQPLYRDRMVFSMDKANGLTCFDLATGRKLWDDGNTLTPRGRNPHASIVWINDEDRILAVNAVGELVVARINHLGYHEQSRRKLFEGRAWGHPAFSGKFLYVRSDGAEQWRGAEPHHLMCFQMVE